MSKLRNLISELCPDGVARVSLNQVGTFIRGAGIEKSELSDHGFPAIHYGEIHMRYGLWANSVYSYIENPRSSYRQAQNNDLIIVTTSEDVEGVGKPLAWVGSEAPYVSGETYIFRHSQNAKYLAYLLKDNEFQTQKLSHITGTKVKRIHESSFAKIKLQIPPLAVQNEIVKILDTFTELGGLEAELEAELEVRKKQHEHFRRRLMSCEGIEHSVKLLGEVGKVQMCKRILKHETSIAGEVPFFKIGTFGGTPDAFISRRKFEEFKGKYPFPKPGTLLISAAGTIGKVVRFDGADSYFQDSNIVWLEHDESIVLNRYLYHCYKIARWTTNTGSIPRLYNSNLLKLPICVPNLDEQERISNILDAFEELTTGISTGIPAEINARRKQYEYYRNKLLTFKELEVA